MNAVTLSSKFQISIPKQVREQQSWKVGQKLAFVQQGKQCILVPVPAPEELFGIAKGASADGYRDRKDRY
jgi:AbrB family looped-hinge helix DNA binding protein